MGKNKLQRFDEISRLENVLQYTEVQENPSLNPAGKWASHIFENKRPIVLELACGKGEYTVNLAQKNRSVNYIGVDIKGARIWKGARRAYDEGMPNVRFLRIFIEHLADYFAPGEVEEIWITFPDPFLKSKKIHKRLTSPRFLEIYRRVLKPGGSIHLKTDSPELFTFTLETIERENAVLLEQIDDVYLERPDDETLTIQTFYEKSHLEQGRTIRYVRFALGR